MSNVALVKMDIVVFYTYHNNSHNFNTAPSLVPQSPNKYRTDAYIIYNLKTLKKKSISD